MWIDMNRGERWGMTRSKWQQVGIEPAPLQDSANMAQKLLLGELEAVPRDCILNKPPLCSAGEARPT